MDKILFEEFETKVKATKYANIFNLEYDEVSENVRISYPSMDSTITAEKGYVEVEVGSIKRMQELYSLSYAKGDKDYFFTYDENGINSLVSQLDTTGLLLSVIHGGKIAKGQELKAIHDVIIADVVADSIPSQPEVTLTVEELNKVVAEKLNGEMKKYIPSDINNITEAEYIIYALKILEICVNYGTEKPEPYVAC